MLVERADELAALDRLLVAAREGAGGALLIEGAAGLGKSRLVLEAIASARRYEMTVLRARASVTEREFGFAVVRQLMEPTLAAADGQRRKELLAGSAALAAPLFADPGEPVGTGKLPGSGEPAGAEGVRGVGEPTGGTASLLHGLYWLLVNLAEGSGPLLVCVDDVDVADEPSVRFLSYLARRVDGLPVALLLTARPMPRGGDGEPVADLRSTLRAGLVRLRTLRPGGVAELVRASVPGADADFCSACADITDGNPFYVSEVLLALAESGTVGDAAGTGWLHQVGGSTVQRAGLFRLLRAGRSALLLAEALAVWGLDAPLRRVAALAGLSPDLAAAAADALEAEDLATITGDRIAYRHALLSQSVYAELPPAQRALAHGRAARILAAENAPLELIAAHLLRSVPAADSWVVQTLRQTAARARAQGAVEAAVRQLQRALAEPPEPGLRRILLTELGTAESAAGMPAGVTHLAEAAELCVELADRVGTARLLAAALAAQGSSRQAVDTLERAMELLAGRRSGSDVLADSELVDTDLVNAVVADYLANAMFETDLRQRALARAAPLLEQVPDGGTHQGRRLLAILAMRSGQRGEPAANTIRLAERAWQAGALLHDEGPGGAGALMTIWAAELAEAHHFTLWVSGEVIDAARRVGSMDAFATASYFHGKAQFERGQLVAAQADVEQALAAGRAGWQRYLTAAMLLRANILLARGQVQAATAAVDEVAPGSGNMFEDAWLLHARGLLALANDRPADALELFGEAGRFLTERLGVEYTVLPWRAHAAHAAIAAGQADRAAELAAAARALAERAGTGVDLGRSLRVQGLLAPGQQGIDLLDWAASLFETAQAQLEQARALADLGAALRRAGRRTDARVPLLTALELATSCGANPTVDRIRRELSAAGARPRRAVQAGRDALTPSELRVSELATRGLTNAQIAQSLFVTPKTVEYHLRNVFAKLGVTRRAELAAALEPSS